MLVVVLIKEHQARNIQLETKAKSKKLIVKYLHKNSAISVSIKSLQDSRKQKNQHVSMRRNVSNRSIWRV